VWASNQWAVDSKNFRDFDGSNFSTRNGIITSRLLRARATSLITALDWFERADQTTTIMRHLPKASSMASAQSPTPTSRGAIQQRRPFASSPSHTARAVSPSSAE
jgi:hypothetical protein